MNRLLTTMGMGHLRECFGGVGDGEIEKSCGLQLNSNILATVASKSRRRSYLASNPHEKKEK